MTRFTLFALIVASVSANAFALDVRQTTQTVYKTVYETVTEEVQQVDPRTGEIRTYTVYKEVPRQVAVEVPVDVPVQNNQVGMFLVRFQNNHDYPVTVAIGQQQNKVQPGRTWDAQAFHGQEFEYYGPPTMGAGGRMLGGAIMRGQVSAQQRLISLGQARQNPQPANNAMFNVKFVNRYSSPVTIVLYSPQSQVLGQRTLQPFEEANASVAPGAWYEQQGPVVFNPNGTSKSGTSRGALNPASPVINLQN